MIRPHLASIVVLSSTRRATGVSVNRGDAKRARDVLGRLKKKMRLRFLTIS